MDSTPNSGPTSTSRIIRRGIAVSVAAGIMLCAAACGGGGASSSTGTLTIPTPDLSASASPSPSEAYIGYVPVALSVFDYYAYKLDDALEAKDSEALEAACMTLESSAATVSKAPDAPTSDPAIFKAYKNLRAAVGAVGSACENDTPDLTQDYITYATAKNTFIQLRDAAGQNAADLFFESDG